MHRRVSNGLTGPLACGTLPPEHQGMLAFPTDFTSPISPSVLAQHHGAAKGPRVAFGLEGAC